MASKIVSSSSPNTAPSVPPHEAQSTVAEGIHIPRSIAHSEVAVNRHKRLQKTKLCKYGEDCAYRAIGRCFYAHSIDEVQPRPPKTEEEIAAEHAETLRNLVLQEQAAAMLAANPWCNPQVAALAASSMGLSPFSAMPGLPNSYGAPSAAAYWALMAQVATAGEMARAAGTTAISSPQLIPPELLAAASGTAAAGGDPSSLLAGFGGLPPPPPLDLALLGLQGDGLLPSMTGGAAGGDAPTLDSGIPDSFLLTKPPGLLPRGTTPDASSRAPSVDANKSEASDVANEAMETQSAFGGNKDLASFGITMDNKSKSR